MLHESSTSSHTKIFPPGHRVIVKILTDLLVALTISRRDAISSLCRHSRSADTRSWWWFSPSVRNYSLRPGLSCIGESCHSAKPLRWHQTVVSVTAHIAKITPKSLYSLIWDFLLSQIDIWTTTAWSNVWVVLPKPSWYEFLHYKETGSPWQSITDRGGPLCWGPPHCGTCRPQVSKFIHSLKKTTRKVCICGSTCMSNAFCLKDFKNKKRGNFCGHGLKFLQAIYYREPYYPRAHKTWLGLLKSRVQRGMHPCLWTVSGRPPSQWEKGATY